MPGSGVDPPLSLIAKLPWWAMSVRSILAPPSGRQPLKPDSNPGLPTRLPGTVVAGALESGATVELAASASVSGGDGTVASVVGEAIEDERDARALTALPAATASTSRSRIATVTATERFRAINADVRVPARWRGPDR